MKVYRGFQDKRLKRRPRSVAIGVFDGVHRGHRKILARVLSDARRFHARPMVVTFDPHPARVLMPRASHPSILMSLAHRLRFFEALGLAEALVVRFDRRFSKIPREVFLDKLLLGRLGMRSLAVGADFRFGHRALGDAAFLRARSRQRRFALTLVRPAKSAQKIISSTRVRERIERGRLREASQMLGRPVSVCGTVIHGRGRGPKTGFPTANLDPHHETLPPPGVYAVFGWLGRKRLKGVVHIGARPTFHDRQKSLEVHFLNFHKNIYGKELELIFLDRLRPIRRFAGPRALSSAILNDIRRARRIFALQSLSKPV